MMVPELVRTKVPESFERQTFSKDLGKGIGATVGKGVVGMDFQKGVDFQKGNPTTFGSSGKGFHDMGGIGGCMPGQMGGPPGQMGNNMNGGNFQNQFNNENFQNQFNNAPQNTPYHSGPPCYGGGPFPSGNQSGFGGNQNGFGGNQNGFGGNQNGFGGNSGGPFGGKGKNYNGGGGGYNGVAGGYNNQGYNNPGYNDDTCYDNNGKNGYDQGGKDYRSDDPKGGKNYENGGKGYGKGFQRGKGGKGGMDRKGKNGDNYGKGGKFQDGKSRTKDPAIETLNVTMDPITKEIKSSGVSDEILEQLQELNGSKWYTQYTNRNGQTIRKRIVVNGTDWSIYWSDQGVGKKSNKTLFIKHGRIVDCDYSTHFVLQTVSKEEGIAHWIGSRKDDRSLTWKWDNELPEWDVVESLPNTTHGNGIMNYHQSMPRSPNSGRVKNPIPNLLGGATTSTTTGRTTAPGQVVGHVPNLLGNHCFNSSTTNTKKEVEKLQPSLEWGNPDEDDHEEDKKDDHVEKDKKDDHFHEEDKKSDEEKTERTKKEGTDEISDQKTEEKTQVKAIEEDLKNLSMTDSTEKKGVDVETEATGATDSPQDSASPDHIKAEDIEGETIVVA